MKRQNIFERVSKSGIRVVGEVIPSAYSASISVWVAAGPVYEHDGERGISHFIEHMVFKGTKTRNAKQLAAEMDAVGGSMNAFTAKESTCFYTRTLSEDMGLALDILLDMICNPLFAENDIASEKGVVCEEIHMGEDDPEDVAHEALCSTIYAGSPLGYPILGTVDSVNSLTRDKLISYMDRRYTPDKIVISCSGNFSPDELVRLVDEKYIPREHTQADDTKPENIFVPGRQTVLVQKEGEQAHICLAFPTERLFGVKNSAISILSSVLGGASSSRLFQHIREEEGLAYSVYSMNSPYSDTGYLTIYAATSEENTKEVLRCIKSELDKLYADGLTQAEFDDAKEHLRRGYLLGLETVSVHASALGKDMLFLGHTRDDDEILEKLLRTTNDDVTAMIRKIFAKDMCLTVVSRNPDKDVEKILSEMVFD